jgi:hypothetical protein
MIYKLENVNRSQARLTAGQSFGSRFLTLILILIGLASFACAPAPTNSNASMTGNSNASASANPAVEPTMNSNTGVATEVNKAAFAAREPEQYSLTMTITGQGSASNKQGTLPPQKIEFARLASDRRWAFTLPAIGEVVYLEKPTMRYLILPSRNQYVEIAPDSLGFQLGNALTPSAMIERLKPHTQYENLGTETVNGRSATKYRFIGAADTHTKAGTVQSDTFVYLDEATGLPLRADLNFASSSGGSAQGLIETQNIELTPDTKLFDVPVGYKKMTAEELKQQVQGFIQFIRVFAPMIAQQPAQATPPPAYPGRP